MDLLQCLAEELREAILLGLDGYLLVRISVASKFWRENAWRYIRSLDEESFRLMAAYLSKEDIGILFDEKSMTRTDRGKMIEELFKNLHKKCNLQRIIIRYSSDIHKEQIIWRNILQRTSFVFKTITHLELFEFDELGKEMLNTLLRATPSLTTLVLRQCIPLESTYAPGMLFKSTLTDLVLDRSFKQKYYSDKSSLVDKKYTSAMPNLRRLELIEMNENDYSGLQILTNLTRLSLKDNTLLDEHNILNIITLTSLKELDLSGTFVSAQSLSSFNKVKIIQTGMAFNYYDNKAILRELNSIDLQNEEEDEYAQDAFTIDLD